MSKFVYNLRIKKYKDRLNKIKQDLPVVEARLHASKDSVKENRKNCG